MPLSTTAAASRYLPPHIAGGNDALTPAQRELVERAAEVGRTRLAPNAARHDREASFPFDSFEDLRQAGLLALCVPRSHGGLDADFPTYALVVAELGRHCAATALSFNMHASACMGAGLIADLMDMSPAQREEHERHRGQHFERIVRHGKLYAQPFSEGGAAAAGKAPWSTQARRVDGGYRINGRKIFASLSGAADYFGVLCTLERPGATLHDTLYLAVPGDAPGLSVCGEWDPLGMRGTVSRSLLLQDVFVPDSARLMPEGPVPPGHAALPAHVHHAVAHLHGHRAGGLRFHGAVPACRVARHVAGEAAHVPDQAGRRGRNAHQAGADACAVPAKRARGRHRPGRRHPAAPVCGPLHRDGERQCHQRAGPSHLRRAGDAEVAAAGAAVPRLALRLADAALDGRAVPGPVGRECLYAGAEGDESLE
jgi:alkylation response protein AidB-like acyl-CoA dehydrogenase